MQKYSFCLYALMIFVKTNAHYENKKGFILAKRCESEENTQVFIAHPKYDYFVTCYITNDMKYTLSNCNVHHDVDDQDLIYTDISIEDNQTFDLYWEEYDGKIILKLSRNLTSIISFTSLDKCRCAKVTFQEQSEQEKFQIDMYSLMECTFFTTTKNEISCSNQFRQCSTCSISEIVIVENDTHGHEEIEVITCENPTCKNSDESGLLDESSCEGSTEAPNQQPMTSFASHQSTTTVIIMGNGTVYPIQTRQLSLDIILPVVFVCLFILVAVAIVAALLFRIRRRKRHNHANHLKSNGFSSTTEPNPYTDEQSVRGNTMCDPSGEYAEIRDTNKSDSPERNRMSEIEMFDNHYYIPSGLCNDTNTNQMYEQTATVPYDNEAVGNRSFKEPNDISTHSTHLDGHLPYSTVGEQKNNASTGGTSNGDGVSNRDSDIEMFDNDAYDSGPTSSHSIKQ